MRKVIKTSNMDTLISLLDSEPIEGEYGDLYFNTTDNQIYRHNGKMWEVVLHGSLDPSTLKMLDREKRLSQLLDKDKKDDKNFDK